MNQWEWSLLEDRVMPEGIPVNGTDVRQGSRVILRPHAGGDILDLALAGRVAVVESIEQDYEGRMQLAVVLEDDPGRDMGVLRQPGHRFFFTAEEVEPVVDAPRILVAGIGNIFLGDDAFGVEVVRRLGEFPDNIEVKDFGIRSYDLAYALLDDHDFVILVDAAPRGDEPGTLYVIEPELDSAEPAIDAHALNPVSVLNLARSMGTVHARILLVGCEPAELGGEEGQMGLSPAVAGSVDGAADLIQRLIGKILEGGKPEELFQVRKDGPHGDDAHE